MRDLIIIIVVAIGFPLFGLAVFFWWRYTYGVWSPRAGGRGRDEAGADVRVISTDRKDGPET